MNEQTERTWTDSAVRTRWRQDVMFYDVPRFRVTDMSIYVLLEMAISRPSNTIARDRPRLDQTA